MSESPRTPLRQSTFFFGKKLRNDLMHFLLFLCASVSIATTALTIIVLAYEAIGFFEEVSLGEFFLGTEWTPLFYKKSFGILPLLCGTFLVSFIALVVAIPLGLITAIYLSEFARPWERDILKPLLEILAGIPTVVYGYFAFLFVTPLLRTVIPSLSGFNALSPGIVMGVMILPMVASLSEDALYTVPKSLKEGAYALGSRKLQVIFRVQIPSALAGILVSCVLAMSRAMGETMIVTIAAGQQPRMTLNPFEPAETITAFIVQVSLGDTPHGTLEYKTIFALGGALFVLTYFLNGISLWIRGRFQQVYRG